jgi:DNA-binding XRE family transcriptional regulator
MSKHDVNPIRAARVAAKLTQHELGRRLGVKRQTVCGWEKGRFRPEVDSAKALAKKLPGLTIEKIYSIQLQGGKS